jgi:hypothetical protein
MDHSLSNYSTTLQSESHVGYPRQYTAYNMIKCFLFHMAPHRNPVYSGSTSGNRIVQERGRICMQVASMLRNRDVIPPRTIIYTITIPLINCCMISAQPSIIFVRC